MRLFYLVYPQAQVKIQNDYVIIAKRVRKKSALTFGLFFVKFRNKLKKAYG